MKKKIYSRKITQEGGGIFVDRIQVEEVNGIPHITAHSKIHTVGGLENCSPHPISGIVKSLIEGNCERPYILEP